MAGAPAEDDARRTCADHARPADPHRADPDRSLEDQRGNPRSPAVSLSGSCGDHASAAPSPMSVMRVRRIVGGFDLDGLQPVTRSTTPMETAAWGLTACCPQDALLDQRQRCQQPRSSEPMDFDRTIFPAGRPSRAAPQELLDRSRENDHPGDKKNLEITDRGVVYLTMDVIKLVSRPTSSRSQRGTASMSKGDRRRCANNSGRPRTPGRGRHADPVRYPPRPANSPPPRPRSP